MVECWSTCEIFSVCRWSMEFWKVVVFLGFVSEVVKELRELYLG